MRAALRSRNVLATDIAPIIIPVYDTMDVDLRSARLRAFVYAFHEANYSDTQWNNKNAAEYFPEVAKSCAYAYSFTEASD